MAMPNPVAEAWEFPIATKLHDGRMDAQVPLEWFSKKFKPWLHGHGKGILVAYIKDVARSHCPNQSMVYSDEELSAKLKAVGGIKRQGKVMLVPLYILQRALKKVHPDLNDVADAIHNIRLHPMPAPTREEYTLLHPPNAAAQRYEGSSGDSSHSSESEGAGAGTHAQHSTGSDEEGGGHGNRLAPLTNLAATIRNAVRPSQLTVSFQPANAQQSRDNPSSMYFQPEDTDTWPECPDTTQLSEVDKYNRFGLFVTHATSRLPIIMPIAKELAAFKDWSTAPFMAATRPKDMAHINSDTYATVEAVVSSYLGFCRAYQRVADCAISLRLFTNINLWVKFMSFQCNRGESSQRMTNITSACTRVLSWLASTQPDIK